MLAVKDSHETAATQFVQVGGNRLAYRRFGRPSDCPLLLLNYFAAAMDDWDPRRMDSRRSARSSCSTMSASRVRPAKRLQPSPRWQMIALISVGPSA